MLNDSHLVQILDQLGHSLQSSKRVDEVRTGTLERHMAVKLVWKNTFREECAQLYLGELTRDSSKSFKAWLYCSSEIFLSAASYEIEDIC